MIRTAFFSVVVVLSVFFVSGKVLATPLANGQKLSDSISVSGEVDEHTFSASAGNTVFLRAADIGDTSFAPKLTLVDPDGIVVTSNSGSLVAHIDARFLVKTGTYTVHVEDDSFSGTATGLYDIYYAKAPGANDNGVLPNGEMLSDDIDLGDIDTYTFSANAGDTIFLRVADTETTEFINSAFDPHVTLIDPDGIVVTSNSGALVAHIDSRALVKSGTYTVVVIDNSFGDDQTGSYDITLARTPGANDDGVLPNGETLPSEISLGDLDTYTFSAVAGDTIFLRVADTETNEFINSAFEPHVTLVDPDGAVVTANGGSLVAHLDAIALVKTGVYSVIVRDDSFGDDETGSYDIYYAKAPGADDDGVLPNGGSKSGDIALGDLDTYVFSVAAGDTVFLRVADTETTEFINSSFNPHITLIDPDGSVVTANGGALVAHIDARELVKSGVYTVVVRDDSFSDDNIGSYDIYYAKAPGASDDGCVGNGQSADGYIDLGDIDSYNFSASAGTSILVSVTDLDASPFVPNITLLAPDGGLINADSDGTTAQINQTLIANGIYTLIVRDDSFSDAEIGNYQISMSGAGVVCPILDCNGMTVTVSIGANEVPTSGPDVILGTSGADIIFAMGGDDTICGLGGDDDINGGRGNDWIDAGGGDDTVQGGNDQDEIYGDIGNDTLLGGPGNDTISGEEGDDFIKGNSGDDSLDGGDGIDKILGGADNDTIYTGSGSNVGTTQSVTGGNGNDTIFGGPDADEIRGEAGNDTIKGGDSNDRLFGGGGEDDINGDAGDDLVRGNAASDTLRGGDGNDQIDGLGSQDLMYGGNGADTMNGSTGNDTMFGQTGNDSLNGGGGNDALNGGGGIDDCDGAGGTGDSATSCETETNIP